MPVSEFNPAATWSQDDVRQQTRCVLEDGPAEDTINGTGGGKCRANFNSLTFLHHRSMTGLT